MRMDRVHGAPSITVSTNPFMDRGTWVHMTMRRDQVAVQGGETVHRVPHETHEAVRSYPVGAHAGAGFIIFEKLPGRFVLCVGNPKRRVPLEPAKSGPQAGPGGLGDMRENEPEAIVNYHRT